MLHSASAPGSLMLLGEYAVLQGGHALVCAVDKRMHVTLTPRDDNRILIRSALGFHETTQDALISVAPFQFVITALQQHDLPSGCEIEIASEFSDKIGFASSAAVTVATLAAIAEWLNLTLTPLLLAAKAREIVRCVQGMGSGADVAACVNGGVIGYRAEPFTAIPIPLISPPEITVIYSGSKTPTVEAIQFVQNKFKSDPNALHVLCDAIDTCAQEGIAAATHNAWQTVGSIFDRQQSLMQQLGVSTPAIEMILHKLQVCKNINGAKISGSGLGDCVVGLGAIENPLADQIPVAITTQGVTSRSERSM